MDTVSLDLETTGVYPPADAILEMAVVDHDGHVLLPGRRLTAPGGRGAALTLSTSSGTNLVRKNGEGGSRDAVQ